MKVIYSSHHVQIKVFLITLHKCNDSVSNVLSSQSVLPVLSLVASVVSGIDVILIVPLRCKGSALRVRK